MKVLALWVTVATKRLIVWLLERSCEALLLSVLLLVISGRSEQTSLARDALAAVASTAIVFMIGSGYLLTTFVFGVVWRSQILWLYPLIVAALFVAHYQFLFSLSDLRIQMPGAGIVAMCCLLGNLLLRKWVLGTGKSPTAPREA